jgi:hypothetical protein
MKRKGWLIPAVVHKVYYVKGATEEEAIANFSAGEQEDEIVEDEDFFIDEIEWAPEFDDDDEEEEEYTKDDHLADEADAKYEEGKFKDED